VRGLLNRIVVNNDDVSAGGRGRFGREGRPDNGPGLRAKGKAEDDAKNDSFHIGGFVCSICAKKMRGRLGMNRGANPPADTA